MVRERSRVQVLTRELAGLMIILVVKISNADKNKLIISKSLFSVMPLSSYRMHRIYLAATMNYGLGSYDPDELAYYNKIKKDLADMKKRIS